LPLHLAIARGLFREIPAGPGGSRKVRRKKKFRGKHISLNLFAVEWVNRGRSMVRRYRDLVEEIRERQRFTRVDWTKKIIEALQYTIEQIQKSPDRLLEEERITYDQWREWQETLAKQYGFSETTDTPPDKSLRNHGWQKVPATAD
jgi:hypothetical protein